eukprot:362100-Chlamydomonas_euryale.AAC.1
MLDNVRELRNGAAGGGGGAPGGGSGYAQAEPSDSLVRVQHRVPSQVKRSKVNGLREQCTQQLGYHFGDVYAYLRRARGSNPPVPEPEVQKRLLALVGNNDGLMHGCYLVDQLVFQESMWTGPAKKA